MSFTLKSIEIKNIRAHEHFLFEPALEGVTAISGDNGAGKSTIVDAFAWGLYGIRPTGVRNKDLIRDGVKPTEKPVSVKSVLNIGGIDYAIERKIINATGSVECNVWGKKAGETELNHIAGPGVSHVEKFIRNELGMNEKGFLTSVLIQQKQVDQIVSASPRERGAVIEELTGISSITDAIRKTNENTRALEKATSMFEKGNVEEAQEKVGAQEEVCKDLQTKENDAVESFNERKKLFDNKVLSFQNERDKVRTRIRINQEITGLKQQVQFLEKQSVEDLKYIESFNEKYGEVIHTDESLSRKELGDVRNENYKFKSKLDTIKANLNKSEKQIKECESLIGAFEDIKSAESSLEKATVELVDKKKELDKSKDKRISLMSEIKHSKASHEHISGEEENCPVCKSEIENPEELKAEIKREIEEFEKAKKETETLVKKLASEIDALNKEVEKIAVSIDAISNKEKLEKEVSDLNSKYKDTADHLISSDAKLKELEANYNEILKIEADKSSLEAAKKRSETASSSIKENNIKILSLVEQMEELNSLSDQELEDLEAKINQEQGLLTNMSVAGKELRARRGIELERLGDYKSNLDRVQDAVDRYNKIAEQIDISAAASNMLSAFKVDRIESAIPTLEFFASDFLSKFTGGTFTKLTVDEKFNTFVVTEDNVKRPVAQLSGGELSSASIALRLGIAMLLNPSEKNVLILDEVLVSMDEDRARQIMETVASMTNSQIIFIAHNTDINSVADKTVLVRKE